MNNQTTIQHISVEETNARILHFLQTAQYAEAEKLCAWLLSSQSQMLFEANFYLGVALQFQGKTEHALDVFKATLELSPNNTNVMQAVASCLDQLKRYEESHELLLQVLKLVPNDAAINANLGVLQERLGNAKEALAYYDAALNLDAKSYVALMNRGALLANTGKKLEALKHSRMAHAIHPEAIGTLFNLVDSLIGVYKYEEALAYCEAGLAWQPRHANLLFKKGLVLSCLKQFDEAHQCLAKAQVIDNDVMASVLPFVNSTDSMVELSVKPEALYLDAMFQAQTRCYWEYRADLTNTLGQWMQDDAYKDLPLSNLEFGFSAIALAMDGQKRLKLCSNIAELVNDFAWLMGVPPFKHHTHKHERIRIGYFSSDFRAHPTGLLSKQIYGLHDKSAFEIFIYSTHNSKTSDHVREAVLAGCDHFKDVSALSDREVAELIHADEIDILVEMNGYTARARTHVMAMRPAPIQLQYLAYIQSMGADFIDYTILDNTVCPVEFEQVWHEKVVKLPHSFYPYDTETSAAPTTKSRADYGLPETGFVFCCLNTSYKIEPDVFAVWMEILHAVPNSVLWLLGVDELTIENITREAVVREVAKERIVFADTLPMTEHLARYQLADLFIDTFWYGAHTTGLDALWQGLPVLYFIGEVPTSRVGASFIRVLEMPELVTNDFKEYKEKAIYYATHPEALKALKQKLQEKKKTTPLFDTPLTVKHIEWAYQHMWQRYHDGLPPSTFDVPDLRELKSESA